MRTMKTKRAGRAVLSGMTLTAAFMLTACGSGSGQTVSVPSVLDDGVLIVGVANGEDRSCFATTDDNGEAAYGGWEPEVLSILDEQLEEVKIQYVYAQDQAELLSMLGTGTIEMAAGGFTKLEAYTSQYLVSNNYGYGSLYLVGEKNAFIDTVSAYTDEKIGISASIPPEQVSEIPGIESVVQSHSADITALGNDIRDGIVIAGVCTEREALYYLTDPSFSVTELHGGPQIGLVFLLPAGQTGLLNEVNTAIAAHYDELARLEQPQGTW